MKTATAGLRMANAGAATTGGIRPSKRSPVSGSSAETRGEAWMHLRADMMGDEAHDPLAVRGRETLTRIGQSFGQPIDPQPAIGIEHHLDDARVFEPGGDRRTERGAQHARTARGRLPPE